MDFDLGTFNSVSTKRVDKCKRVVNGWKQVKMTGKQVQMHGK